MGKLYLTKPSADYAEQIMAYRQEFLECGEHLHGASLLQNYPNIEDWFVWLRTLSNSSECPPNFVPSEQYLCVRAEDKCVVGMINIRYELNDFLFRLGGHIGYSVRPSERKKGYAKAQLAMMLQEAGKHGLEQALVTCNEDNEASRRTILANGGILENEMWDEDDKTFVQRYWIEL